MGSSSTVGQPSRVRKLPTGTVISDGPEASCPFVIGVLRYSGTPARSRTARRISFDRALGWIGGFLRRCSPANEFNHNRSDPSSRNCAATNISSRIPSRMEGRGQLIVFRMVRGGQIGSRDGSGADECHVIPPRFAVSSPTVRIIQPFAWRSEKTTNDAFNPEFSRSRSILRVKVGFINPNPFAALCSEGVGNRIN